MNNSFINTTVLYLLYHAVVTVLCYLFSFQSQAWLLVLVEFSRNSELARAHDHFRAFKYFYWLITTL
jgi:hypothetical protein